MIKPNTKWALSTVIWSTFITWVPITLLLALPNDWYWILLKVPVGLALLGFIHNFWFARPDGIMGPTGPGFVISAGLFSILFFSVPDWVRYLIGALIGMLLYVIFYGMSRRAATEGGDRGARADNP